MLGNKLPMHYQLYSNMNFDEVFTLKNLYDCGYSSCSGVRWKSSTQNFECQLMRNVCNLKYALDKNSYKSKGFHYFYKRERGKERYISSVHISERTIQKCLCDYCLLPTFTPKFIYDNAACLKGKGLHFAIRRLKTHLHRYYLENQSNEGYILLFDVKNFFGSIDHKLLVDMVGKHIKDERLLKLYKYFIDCFKGNVGIGLGSQVSQVSASIYMNGFDHHFKDVLGLKYFARYMDDGYIISRSKKQLEWLRTEIVKQLEMLKLTPNLNKTQIYELKGGFTYLKRKITLYSSGKVVTKPYKKNIQRYKRKVNKLLKKNVAIANLVALNSTFVGYLKEFNYYDRYTRTIKGADELCLHLNKKSQT